ncbi:hypothetical protein QAD02_019680 [Eretmocerus hayati]|uniref:Uncharacterized protein n=1 Tax=Eretmocerus hayati TaxID=131215 RepID=A0ACC2PK98_9HYME|nr:hypothetical protein QAD02_019680 [Eretmocerus hayati]
MSKTVSEQWLGVIRPIRLRVMCDQGKGEKVGAKWPPGGSSPDLTFKTSLFFSTSLILPYFHVLLLYLAWLVASEIIYRVAGRMSQRQPTIREQKLQDFKRTSLLSLQSE